MIKRSRKVSAGEYLFETDDGKVHLAINLRKFSGWSGQPDKSGWFWESVKGKYDDIDAKNYSFDSTPLWRPTLRSIKESLNK